MAMDEGIEHMIETPRLISWNLTRVCNLACGHCYLDAVQRRREAPDELTTDEALRVVEEIAQLAPGAMLVLTGGEPLLRRDLDTLVAAAAARELMPVIGSNGTLLDARRAAALRAAGAVGVGISLDSITPAFHDRLRGQDGAWEKAVAGLRAAREAGLAVQVQTTLFRENLGAIEAIADCAEELGALALNLFFLVCTGRGVTQTDLAGAEYEAALARIAALQQRRDKLMIRARCAPYVRRMLGLHAADEAGSYASWSSACLAGRSYCRITPEGRVTACPYIPQAAGDLREQGLRAVWEEAPDFRRLRGEMPGGKCGGCDYRVSCGGCRARALAADGDLMGGDAKCGYLPPPGAVPEARPAPKAGTVAWTPDAQALLARIPGFVRERVRERLEAAAAREDAPAITLDFMRAHRPQGAFLAAFGRRPA
jgi:radical SAM protein with 4Fe4S-binding SPASM domain